MDELDLLKKDWKKQESSFQQIGEKEIYGMLHKRSSSIVKWILIISVLEIIFWSFLIFSNVDEKYSKTLDLYHLKTFSIVYNIINYIIALFFISQFYLNYIKVKTTDNVNRLMEKILIVRKTVKKYVLFNLILFGFGFIITLISQL